MRRFLLLIFVAVMAVSCHSRQEEGTFTVTIDLRGTVPGDQLVLTDYDTIKHVHTIERAGENVSFKEIYQKEAYWHVEYYRTGYAEGDRLGYAVVGVFVDGSSDYRIVGRISEQEDYNTFVASRISGGIYDKPAFATLWESSRNVWIAEEKYWMAVENEASSEEIRELEQKSALEDENYRREIIRIVENQPNEVYSAYMLQGFFRHADPDRIDSIYRQLAPSVRHSHSGIRVEQKLETYRAALGAPAYDFSLKDLDGEQVKLSDYRGKWVLLDFWGSWCTACRQNNPALVALYNRYKCRNFTILGMANDNLAAIRRAVIEDNLPWRQAMMDTRAIKEEITSNYIIECYPTKILIDPEGRTALIVAGNRKPENDPLYAKLSEIFDAPVTR